MHFNVPEFRQHLVDKAHDRLDALLAQEPDAAGMAKPMVVVGRAYRQVLRVAAEQGAELVVMGALGRGEPGLTRFGSTTHQVAAGAGGVLPGADGPRHAVRTGRATKNVRGRMCRPGRPGLDQSPGLKSRHYGDGW